MKHIYQVALKNALIRTLEVFQPARGPIMPEGIERIYHVHLPKSGGTSINHAFLAWQDGDDAGKSRYEKISESLLSRYCVDGRVYQAWVRQAINRGNYFYAFSHKPLWKLELKPNTFTMTCLRDPVRRLVSQYRMMIAMRDKVIDHKAFEGTGQRAWLGDGFDDYLELCPREKMLKQLYAFSRDLDPEHAAETIRGLDAVLTTERLSEGMLKVAQRLQLPIKVGHVRKAQGTPINLADKTLARARELLAPEYAMLESVNDVII